MPWKQFTVYYPGSKNTQFPLGCLVGFLPEFERENREHLQQWHFLFEPGCLVRMLIGDDRLGIVMTSAMTIASKYNLRLETGDIAEAPTSAPSSANAGFDYNVETAFYADLCSYNLKFLEAVSNLSLAAQKGSPERVLQMLSKHIHLLCNAFGLNYAEESRVCQVRAERAAEFYMKVGRV